MLILYVFDAMRRIETARGDATATGFSPLHHIENIEKRYENANISLISFEFFQILHTFFEFCLVTCLVFTESS